MSRLGPEKPATDPTPDPAASSKPSPTASDIIKAIEVFESLGIDLPTSVLLKALDHANRLRVAELTEQTKREAALEKDLASRNRCVRCANYIANGADEYWVGATGPYCSERCRTASP